MTRRRLIDLCEIVFVLAVLLAVTVSLARAEGEALCAPPEPKDVACRIAWDVPTDDGRVARYEIALQNGTHCATRQEWTTIRPRDGIVVIHPPVNWANPYSFVGQCFPAPGVAVSYRVRACDELGLCGGWSAPLTVIGAEVWDALP